MPKVQKKYTDPTQQLTVSMLIISCLLLGIFGWLWWTKIYQSPRGVFRAMINNNLSSYGMSKQVNQKDSTSELSQQTQLQLGATPLTRANTVVTQADQNGQKTSVTTETIGTPTDNYARYTDINTAQKTAEGTSPDFSSVINLWGKESFDKQQTAGGLFTEAVYDIVPFGRLTPKNRQELMQHIRDNAVYKVDYAKMKRRSEAGRQLFDYPVTVAPDKYIAMLQRFDALVGLNQLQKLEPSQYSGEQPIEITISVDSMSRTLAAIRYSAGDRYQTYHAPGAYVSPRLPSTTIPKTELEAKVQQVLGGN